MTSAGDTTGLPQGEPEVLKSGRDVRRRPFAADRLARLPDDMHPVLKRVYAARGIDAAGLDNALAGMIPVSELDGTAAAAERLAQAFANREKVLVVGDFDADGATATALMIHCLRGYGFAEPAYRVPDREKFGYGLSAGIVEELLPAAPQLIVTVDNGISSLAGVAKARSHGIDVLVTDHHLPGELLPDAQVIVNPNLPGSLFPSKALAGVGVAFYVMAALGQRLAIDGYIDAAVARRICADCLDLVALGTVADMVPLDHNNRILVSQGLLRIRKGAGRPGLAALFQAAGRRMADAVASDLGFSIGPRLNAAGRLDDMSVGINCLLAGSAQTARALATQLDSLNKSRRSLQQKMQADAEELVAGIDWQRRGGERVNALCLYDDSWHAGVVGLVATRIREQVNRPVIAFAGGAEDGSLKGSGRSVAGIHMRDVLANIDAANPGLIARFGGHAMAAGLSLARESLDAFRAAFAREVDRCAHLIDDSDTLQTDGELAPADFGLGLAEALRGAGPWGQGCPEPMFDGAFTVVAQRIVGERHLKLELQPAVGAEPLDAIAFNHPELLDTDGIAQCFAVFRLDVNEFRGVRRPQLVVEHIECV